MQVSKTFTHYNNQTYLPRLPYSYLLEKEQVKYDDTFKIIKKRVIENEETNENNKKRKIIEYKYESESENESDVESNSDSEREEKEGEREEKETDRDEEEEEEDDQGSDSGSDYYDDPMDIDPPFDDRYDDIDNYDERDYSMGYEDECYECFDM